MSMRSRGLAAPAVAAVFILTLFSAGCATKKWVQTKVVQPMDAKIHGVDQKTDQNAQQIKDVDQKSEQGISEAKSEAENASKQATDAQKSAQDAQTTASKGVSDAAAAKDFARTYADNLDAYQPVKSATVLFAIGRAALDDQDREKLEDLIQTLPNYKHYALEVQGYTDKTGPKKYNLALSEERADNVVRYLTENGKVPLVRIHVLGYGDDDPVAPNTSRKGRKLNRRVEVRILATQDNEGGSQAASSNSNRTSSSNSNSSGSSVPPTQQQQ